MNVDLIYNNSSKVEIFVRKLVSIHLLSGMAKLSPKQLTPEKIINYIQDSKQLYRIKKLTSVSTLKALSESTTSVFIQYGCT
jgi:hypothetical protein